MSDAAVLAPVKLPKKEQDLFRLVVTLYETKKYTKGVQTADNILKKFPNHGETQSMKGLIFNCMGKKDEALELVKSGVRNDVKSHVCWHVFGLIHKSDNNFHEAIKCYQNALKIDENNQNILRDLSWLQIQVRDIEGFVISRNRILESKPTLRASWVTAAVANYFGGQFQVAFDMVTKYRANPATDKGDNYEEGELLLFQNKCLEKLGKYQKAIDHLKTSEPFVTDKLAIKIKTAELQVLLGNYVVGKELWSALTTSQPDNYRFHCGLQTAYLELDAATSAELFALKRLELPSTTLSLTTEQLTVLKDLYVTLKAQNKKGAASKIWLGFSQGEELRGHLDTFLRANLRSAIPSTFQEVAALIRVPDLNNPTRMRFAQDVFDYKDHEVTRMALNLVEGYITNLRASQQFDASASTAAAEPPTALLWALYLHSHLLEVSGDLDAALKAIDEAIAHTPTAIDMYARRARIQKKQGDYTGAAVTMDECRQLDLQDRYLNNKATKYFLRADETALAMNTIALFTKHDGDPQQTLYELQCNWYELELAESYARTKQWGLALRKFFAVRKHFVEYNDDMFDFHGYCMRKTTIRAYFDSITMLDNSYSHKFYQRALRGALRIFLYLHEFPEDVDGLGHLNPAERKKERLKRKKAIKKIEEKKAEEEEEDEGKAEEKKKSKRDAEPDEEVFLAKDFMAEAVLWSSAVSNRLSTLDAETIALIVDLNVRRSEFSAAVEAVRTGLQKYPGDHFLVHSLVRLALKVKSPGKAKLGPNAPEIRDSLSALVGSPAGTIDVEAFVTAYSSQAVGAKCLPQVLSAIRSKVSLDKTSPATTAAVASLVGEEALLQGKGATVANVLETVKFLSTSFPEEPFTATFKAQARDKYPLAPVYAPLNTVTELRAASSLAAATSANTDAAQKDEGTKQEEVAHATATA